MVTKIDEHLEIVTADGAPVIRCKHCYKRICEKTENYKDHLIRQNKPLTEANPHIVDPSRFIDEEIEYREFYCPKCATLIETEVILAESEPIHDKELLSGDQSEESH